MNVSEPEGGGVFVSYRRQESSGVAGRLADRLSERFGTGRVFMDVDTIEPGVDFTEAIARAVETCEVLLAIIGPGWLTATDEQGCRRLDDADDIVRIEIEAALARNVRVIPILVENAVMPRRQDLPESLASLARRNAFPVRHESFRYDADRLVTSIEGVIGARGREQPTPQPTATTLSAATPSAATPGMATETTAPSAAAQPEKTAQSKSRREEQSTEPGTWELKPLVTKGKTQKFLLLLGRENHEIIITFPFMRDDILEVDGECIAKETYVRGKTYSLKTLSSKLGSNVTITVVGEWAKVTSITLNIGDQVLTYKPEPVQPEPASQRQEAE